MIANSPPAVRTLSSRGLACRLGITCWLVYALHFATNIVREIYPALALGDHLSFRLDEYAHLHPDLFETPGYGWHSGNNPGASMLAAIPYALARPVIDPIVAAVREHRATSGQTSPPRYAAPQPADRQFYAEAWRRGLDVKFGLAAFVMQAFCMAPSSALGAVLMFFVLRTLLTSDGAALWLALLYAFGTPVFFRTGYLNHNLMLGHIAFAGFVALWNPASSPRWSGRTRFALAGLAGGTALLFDYSGAVLLLLLFAYGLAFRVQQAGVGDAFGHGTWYVLGTLPPVGLLWFYQWKSFGNPFLPGQHWMPPVEWIELGYQGYGLPQWELFWALGFDYRFGLFASCPLFLLVLVQPLFSRWSGAGLPRREQVFLFVLFLAFWLFFSGSNYTRLQFITGIRYMAPMFPFLFVLVATVLAALPVRLASCLAVFAVVQSWCLAMYRDVDGAWGVLEPMLRTFLQGPALPVLTTLSRLEPFQSYFAHGPSPAALYLLVGALVACVWLPLASSAAAPRVQPRRRRPRRRPRIGVG